MPCLDGLRGLAAMLVLFGHAPEFGIPQIVAEQAKDYAVLLFFALSGFLMGELYLIDPPSRSRIKAFAIARAARILPIYYVLIFVCFAIYLCHLPFVYVVPPVQFARLLTFTGSVGVFWSIGPEVQFYLAFVALWILRGRLRNDALFALAVLVVAGLCLSLIRSWPGIILPSKFHIFAAGMLVALLRSAIASRVTPSLAVVMHAFALVALGLIVIPTHLAALAPVPFDRGVDPTYAAFYGSLPRTLVVALIVLCLSFESRLGSLVLGNRPARWIGQLSFSIYLIHEIVYSIVNGLFDWQAARSAELLIVVLVTIGVSFLTNSAIEQPGRDVIRRLSRSSARARVTASS